MKKYKAFLLKLSAVYSAMERVLNMAVRHQGKLVINVEFVDILSEEGKEHPYLFLTSSNSLS